MHIVISWTDPTEVTGMEEGIVNEPQYASEFAETNELLDHFANLFVIGSNQSFQTLLIHRN